MQSQEKIIKCYNKVADDYAAERSAEPAANIDHNIITTPIIQNTFK